MVPHLVTALNGPINELEQRILESTPVIERWFRLEWMEHTPPFYSSVDVRNAGFKLAPVDTNLYPGGWNHLTPEMLPLAVQAAMAAIEKICPEAKNLLLVPENRRDTFYLSNLAQLQRLFYMAGLNVRLGSLSNDIKDPTTIELPGGDRVTLELAAAGERHVMRVADTGPGLPADMKGEAFERFVRADRDRGIKGHGLGLALVRAIAVRHGARLVLPEGSEGFALEIHWPRLQQSE